MQTVYCEFNFLFRRIRDVFGDSDRDVEKQDLSQLVYLEAVLKESMRMYTIVPVVARRLDRNVQLSNIFYIHTTRVLTPKGWQRHLKYFSNISFQFFYCHFLCYGSIFIYLTTTFFFL
jgi:hypothetical protein